MGQGFKGSGMAGIDVRNGPE